MRELDLAQVARDTRASRPRRRSRSPASGARPRACAQASSRSSQRRPPLAAQVLTDAERDLVERVARVVPAVLRETRGPCRRARFSRLPARSAARRVARRLGRRGAHDVNAAPRSQRVDEVARLDVLRRDRIDDGQPPAKRVQRLEANVVLGRRAASRVELRAQKERRDEAIEDDRQKIVPSTESGTFLPTAIEHAPAHLGALVDASGGDELRRGEPLEVDPLERPARPPRP